VAAIALHSFMEITLHGSMEPKGATIDYQQFEKIRKIIEEDAESGVSFASKDNQRMLVWDILNALQIGLVADYEKLPELTPNRDLVQQRLEQKRRYRSSRSS
jgi:hypothetical protein